jgi:hypothetical protein
MNPRPIDWPGSTRAIGISSFLNTDHLTAWNSKCCMLLCCKCMYNRSVSIATDYGLEVGVRFVARRNYVSLLYSSQACYGTHPVSYLMGTRRKAAGD